MAEGKKAFIVYTDWLKYTDLMTNEQKGMWIDWCLKYCNDLNPIYPDDSMVKMLCVMCQDILKRDLKKYENKVVSIQNAREKRKCNIETNNEINIENNNDINIATSGVNSNKLIVNSNKLVCDKSHTNNACACEEEKISLLQQLIQDLEQLFGRCLTMKEQAQIELLNKKYSSKTILNEIKNNIDKEQPIAYICKTLSNISKYEDKRKQFEEEIDADEWMQGFYERQRKEEEQRKKELRNED